jgi:hypothetical protein
MKQIQKRQMISLGVSELSPSVIGFFPLIVRTNKWVGDWKRTKKYDELQKTKDESRKS